LPRIAALRHDPVDRLRGGVGAGLDAAMPLLDGCFGNELGGRVGAEIVHDVGFEGRLVALQCRQVIGLVGDDLVGESRPDSPWRR
jgi:hypothetical protein